MHTNVSSSQIYVLVRFVFYFCVCLFSFSILCVFCVRSGHFMFVLLAFIVLNLLPSVPEEWLRKNITEITYFNIKL